METTLIEKIQIRRKKLDVAKKNLKAYFIGLDEIIDKLFNNLEAWYVLPEVVSRPTIINMWGLTGTGKTDLIRRLAKELDFNDKFVEIQMDSSSVETVERSWGCNSVKSSRRAEEPARTIRQGAPIAAAQLASCTVSPMTTRSPGEVMLCSPNSRA